MDGKAGEADGLLTGFAARLAATLAARMAVFEDQKAEACGVEKDAKTIAALGRAAIIIHAVKAAEDKSAEPAAARTLSANNDNSEGDDMEPDERGHTGRSGEDMAALRAEVGRRFERLARSFDVKGVQPDGPGGDDPPDGDLLASLGERGPDPALE